MAVTISGIGRSHNKLYIRFSDNTEIEGTRRELRDMVRDVLDDAAMDSILKTIAVARGLRLAANADSADDFDAMVGQTLSFNRRAPQNLLRIV